MYRLGIRPPCHYMACFGRPDAVSNKLLHISRRVWYGPERLNNGRQFQGIPEYKMGWSLMKQSLMNLTLIVFVSLLCLVWSGCGETTQNPPDEPDEEEFTNPNIPNANELITYGSQAGEPDKRSSIWEIIDSGNGNFYYRGMKNSKYAVGKIDHSGQEIWSFRSGYKVRDCVRISGLSGDLGNSLLGAGGFDSDIDGTNDQGYVSLYNSSGDLIEELVISNDAAAISLCALAVSETTSDLVHLAAVGTAKISDAYYPYFARFTVASDSSMQVVESKIFMDGSTNNFRNIQFDLDQTPARCYLQGDEYSTDSGYGDQAVFRLSDEMEISWDQDIVPQTGLQSWTADGRGFLFSGDNLFMIGNTEFEKEVEPTSGGHWSAGVIACLSTDGSVDWVRTIVLSQYTDSLYGCTMADDGLYVVGSYSALSRTESENLYGNALLVQIDPETGDVTRELSFGNETYRSHFNDVIVQGDQAFAVGYTNYAVSGGSYQSWFVVIDLSTP